MYLRYEIKVALDTNNIQRLLLVLRHPTFNLGHVDYTIARQYMESLKTFRREHSGTFEGIQWSVITHTIQGNYYVKGV